MSGKLIMPKQTGQKDAFYASLELLYNSYKNGEKWYSNDKFKVEIQRLLPYLSKGAQDGPYLVKQSELVRYFGLAEYDYIRDGESKVEDHQIGFIAQDIIDTEVGSKFCYDMDEGMGFSTTGYTSVLAKALQEAIAKIESLEQRIEELESRLDEKE